MRVGTEGCLIFSLSIVVS